MSTEIEFVLIHAPLVGPYTWELVAHALRGTGRPAALPELTSPERFEGLYWQHHVRSVAGSLAAISTSRLLVLVGHSGAGPLLPAIRAGLEHNAAGYIFVDAGLPENGKSRLDLFESFEAARQFRQAAQNGLLPAWSADDLREVIPDAAVRERLASELHPLPLRVYEEPLPVFPGWPDAPVGYLRFGENPAYEAAAQRAQQERFTFMQLEGEHFHMLVDPSQVARALVELAMKMGIFI